MQYNKEEIETKNLELASFISRAIAFIIDDLLITLVVVVLFWEQVNATNGELLNLLMIMNDNLGQILLMKFVYQGFFIWYYGATIGKIVVKIRVVDYDNFGRVSFGAAFIRSFFRLISEMFFYVGFMLAFFTQGRQTLQDKIGKTLVINA
ncbi:RDD family protein [Candidatus Marinarcus aquaticus]|uniref:RDD family protein n=1 Tax=Candidatus Marinarcus aquaticus TaxID=2044504 RepID=A0A4Q0XSZ5_9BACT|nr:RDD family protein [Candidatus Marinarcus aquaticus]RXJ60203.1 RDD family protein [Candidatus Marinarcus aquaticus]